MSDFREGGPEATREAPEDRARPEPESSSGGTVTPPAEDSAPGSDPHPAPGATDDDSSPDTLEDAEARIEADLSAVLAERDEYLEALRRLQADFENYKKRVMKQEAEHLARAAEGLVANLLPVLDACDAALGHGADDVRPVADALFGVLEREGLERLDAVGKPFDPAEHEAVVHEPASDDDASGQVVSDVMRAGYRWKGRVLRPAMVKVRG